MSRKPRGKNDERLTLVDSSLPPNRPLCASAECGSGTPALTHHLGATPHQSPCPSDPLDHGYTRCTPEKCARLTASPLVNIELLTAANMTRRLFTSIASRIHRMCRGLRCALGAPHRRCHPASQQSPDSGNRWFTVAQRKQQARELADRSRERFGAIATADCGPEIQDFDALMRTPEGMRANEIAFKMEAYLEKERERERKLKELA